MQSGPDSEQVKELRDGACWDQLLIFDLLQRMEEMEIWMNLLQAQSSGQVPLVDLTAPDTLGSPLFLSSPAQIPSQ